MNSKRERDEYLEQLWYMQEDGKDSVDVLRNLLGDNYDAGIIDELLSDDFVVLIEDNNKIKLTQKGQDYARQLIRAHRLAERLLHDVLGGDYESGACEFEHTVTPELVDSICILLGHPRACPHLILNSHLQTLQRMSRPGTSRHHFIHAPFGHSHGPPGGLSRLDGYGYALAHP